MLLGVVIESDAVALFGALLATLNGAIAVLWLQFVRAKDTEIGRLSRLVDEMMEILLRHGLECPDRRRGGAVGGRPG